MSEETRNVVLVSTALEETWPQRESIVFLGEWCLRFSRRHVWSALDYSVMPYHWDNRLSIRRDLEYIEEVYESLLSKLAHVLNDLHGVEHSLRYWRIVVGWWLFYFAQIFYDRWQVIQAAEKAYPNARMLRIPTQSRHRASHDTAEFIAAMSEDSWNERLYADIADSWTKIHVETADVKSAEVPQRSTIAPNQRPRNSIQRCAVRIVHRLVHWFKRCRVISRGKVALTADYLSPLAKIGVALKLRQIPLSSPFANPPAALPDQRFRQWHLQSPGNDVFVQALSSNIVAYLPTCFLEGYQRNSQLAQRWGLSPHPEVIMTANAFSGDDLWKLWAGLQIEKGAKLIISQHGGTYGTGAWLSSLKHEIAISDRYISWGWRDPCESKVRPAPATKLIGLKKRRYKDKGICLQVTNSFPRQSYKLSSTPVGPQFARYLTDQHTFARALSNDVRKSLVVRLYQFDYGWDLLERWTQNDPQVTVEPGLEPISKLLSDTKLLVATDNGTTFLESFRIGIPTVMFWDPALWELSSRAQLLFLRLKQVKIFFEDPRSCADHVSAIWNDVAGWWYTEEVQAAVEAFMLEYAYVGPRPLAEFVEALTDWP